MNKPPSGVASYDRTWFSGCGSSYEGGQGGRRITENYSHFEDKPRGKIEKSWTNNQLL